MRCVFYRFITLVLHYFSRVIQRTVKIPARGIGRQVLFNPEDCTISVGDLLEAFKTHPVKGLNSGDVIEGIEVKSGGDGPVTAFGKDMHKWFKAAKSGNMVLREAVQLKAVYVRGPRVRVLSCH